MSTILIAAIIMISLALVFYTWGVWAEHRKGRLELKHLLLFLGGLVFDTAGTVTMSVIASGNETAEVASGINWHAITGGFAIGLMLIHAIWAALVLLKKNDTAQNSFHKFSLIVWILWLIPYVSGAWLAMG